jgi:hypothetical protein
MINRKVFVVFALALASLVTSSNARASETDQAIRFTFGQPVQIPGQVLPAGSYLFVDLAPDIVQVFSSDRSKLYATLFTNVAELPNPADKTTVILAERGPIQPGAIVTWFYPGRTDGHRFVYSKQDRKEMAQATLRTLASGD